MSNYILTAVWRHSRSQGAARLVLLSLADQANDTGWCRVSIENISKRCLISVRSVHRHLDTLVELEEVSRKEIAGRASEYRVRVENLCQSDTPVKVADPTPDDLTDAPANLTDLPLPTVAEGSATAGRQNHSLTTELTTKSTSSSPTADAVDDQDATEQPTPAPQPAPEPQRDDVDRLCTHLADRIEANGSKRPTVTQEWRRQCRLLLDRDGRTEAQVRAAIDWCQNDSFWMANIRSMSKLREQYDTLRLRAIEQAQANVRSQAGGRQQRTNQVFDAAMERARARDEATTQPRQPQGALTS